MPLCKITVKVNMDTQDHPEIWEAGRSAVKGISLIGRTQLKSQTQAPD